MNFTPAFGRLENPDERDEFFPVAAVLPEPNPFITEKYWWDGGWWGNQGSTTQCVAYSWMHWVEDGPVVQDGILANRAKPMFNTSKFYEACQVRDPWPGTNYPGTSVRTAAKVLQELGIVKEYRWANSSEEIAQTLLNLGPVVVGTRWTYDMTHPKKNGLIRPTGSAMGGHAYLLNGVDYERKLFRIKNSWGKDWGYQGYGFISFEDFDTLLAVGGEACVAFENKITEVPAFTKLSPPTSA
jgi:Cysteine protease